MTGYEHHNYPAFAEATSRLRQRGIVVVSPHELHGNDFSRSFDWYLRRDLAALVRCNSIALLPGWEQSRGAALEEYVARALGFQVFRYVDGELEPMPQSVDDTLEPEPAEAAS